MHNKRDFMINETLGKEEINKKIYRWRGKRKKEKNKLGKLKQKESIK